MLEGAVTYYENGIVYRTVKTSAGITRTIVKDLRGKGGKK